MTKVFNLRSWFNKYAKTPVLLIIIIIIVFQIIYIWDARNSQINKRQKEIERLVDIANLGALSSDRVIIETTLDVITHDMGAKKIFFCDKSKLITSFPTVTAFSCLTPDKARFGEDLLVVSPKGTPDFIFYFYFPAFGGLKPILLMLTVFVLFSFFVIRMLQFIRRRIEDDLITPITSLATEGTMANRVKISELDNIANKSKLLKELREAETLAKQAQFMAHDLKRPFSQIKLILSMLDSFSNDKQKLDSAKKDIESSIKNVEFMLSDLIDSTKDTKLYNRFCSVKGLVEQALQQVRLDEKSITVIRSIEDSCAVIGDEQKLIRCLINIVGNAYEAVSLSENKKGIIEIIVNKEELDGKSYVKIFISNNGPCIVEDDLPKIFQSFFTKGKKKGTGLGLAFVQRVVSMHEGLIKAQNKPNKEGVEFIILLPLAKKLGVSETVFSENKKYTLLLLEDEASYRDLIKEMITKDKALSNVNVVEANSVKEAIKVTEKETVNYALIDFDLGDGNSGLNYLDYVNEGKYSIICALHTNKYLDADVKNKLNEYGVVYIPKPLDTNSLSAFFGR